MSNQPIPDRLRQAMQGPFIQMPPELPREEKRDVILTVADLQKKLDQARAQIAELESNLIRESARTADESLRADHFEQRVAMANQLRHLAETELAQANARIAELAQDAARYRWLRNNSDDHGLCAVRVIYWSEEYGGQAAIEVFDDKYLDAEVDAAIDAAIKEDKQ